MLKGGLVLPSKVHLTQLTHPPPRLPSLAYLSFPLSLTKRGGDLIGLEIIWKLDALVFFLVSGRAGIKIQEIYFKVETLGPLSTFQGLN